MGGALGGFRKSDTLDGRQRLRLTPNLRIIFKPLPADDPTQRRPDFRLAKQKLGWQPSIELEEGLKRTIEYFKSVVADDPPGDKPRGIVV